MSITTDTWTSVQRINYMCITAHFIDAEWKWHKKIISFVPIQSHKGESITKALEICLLDWGVKNIVTITVDNASSNDVVVGLMKSKLMSWGCSAIRASYLHMRCIAHILSLVVQDGLKMAHSSVMKLRDTVRWIRGSPARLTKFREIFDWLDIQEKCSLGLDVPTRWNSTYMMLRNAIPYRSAFESYPDRDASYKADLGDSLLVDSDWIYLESFVVILRSFYEMTIRILGSLYVTSNTYLSEISDLSYALTEMMGSSNATERNVGGKMKEKFDKYWGDPEKMTMMIFFSSIFDPRDKTVWLNILLRFSEPSQTQSQSQPQTQPEKCNPIGKVKNQIKSELKKLESGMTKINQSELELYLSEPLINDDDDFDILQWWKMNSARFPNLSRLARDVLALPISTVASESTFSTSGRVLDSFRSSLTPKIVEALLCMQNWLRGPFEPVSVEEIIEELEKFEDELKNLKIGTSSTSKSTMSSVASKETVDLDLDDEL
ncbi:hypothetical protein OSB04_024527 [Centaurea solstitialis]|uniref:Transposase n=1 Tax=Centaurea solstitialis TaxID=347529 RepID=A0AA38WAF3_9ASTR|nr:hypothetical protein OSB04_024527 [Centaurea solstitialis]